MSIPSPNGGKGAVRGCLRRYFTIFSVGLRRGGLAGG